MLAERASDEGRYPGLADFYRGRKVFLTGATGFVGGHLATRLLGYGADVTLLVRPGNPKIAELRSRGFTVALGDLTDRDAVIQGASGAEILFHVGAVYREAKFPDDYYHKVNVDGTRYMLEAAERCGASRFVNCSTNGVHSHIEHPPANESYPFNPSDVYQRSKLKAEELVREWTGRVPWVILRPAMIWGEGDTRFLKLFRGIQKRTMPIFGDGTAWTHWIHVQDLVDVFLLAGRDEQAVNQTYLVAGEKPIPMKTVFQTIAKQAGVTPLPFSIPHRPVQILGDIVEALCRPFGIEPPLHRRRVDFFIKNRAFDTSKLRRELGFTPRQSFEEEARIIYNWYNENGWLK